MEIKITRKLLDDYRRLKREIPLLELELVEDAAGDNGLITARYLITGPERRYPRALWDLIGH